MMMRMKKRRPYKRQNLGQLPGHAQDQSLAPGHDQGQSLDRDQGLDHEVDLDPVLAQNLVPNQELRLNRHHVQDPDQGQSQDQDQHLVVNRDHVPNLNRCQDPDRAVGLQHPDLDPVQALGVQGHGHVAQHLAHAVDLGLAVP